MLLSKKPVYEVAFYGGSGQARVMAEILDAVPGKWLEYVIDGTPGLISTFKSTVKFRSGKDVHKKWEKEIKGKKYGFLVTVGNPSAACKQNLFIAV